MKQWRIFLIIIFIFLLGGLMISRLFTLQVFQYSYYSALAQGQHQLYEQIFPQRGEIFMQDLSGSQRSQQPVYYPLAINKEFEQVYLVPKEISEQDREDLAEKLAQILDLDKEIILARMSKSDDPYEPLKHKVSSETVERIKNLGTKGIGFTAETWRYYPNESCACHLTGFVGISEDERIGQYGLEGYYEKELKGKPGFLAGEKNTAGYWIPSLNQKIEPAEDGSELILTIDPNIQFKAEKELSQLVEDWQAESGTIIITEPTTGAIRAMANWPNFNPNQYGQVEDINIFLNPAIQKVYEPGSVLKLITMAAGLDSGKITPATAYHDSGQVKLKGGIITNFDNKVYGQQTMTQVLEKSINTGAVFVQRTIGPEIFRDYFQRFDLGQPTDVDLTGEVAGNISNLFTNREINLANISFGQGISVTSLGLINAVGAIANQGKMMQPFIVEKIIKSNGEEIIRQPQEIKQVISPETAEELTKMMVSVVENGHSRPARVSGYAIAGKTGTAQIPDLEKGGYSQDETIHTFVGFAPAFNPRFAVLIKIDKPQGGLLAANSTAPVFKRLAEFLFNYLEIPPQ